MVFIFWTGINGLPEQFFKSRHSGEQAKMKEMILKIEPPFPIGSASERSKSKASLNQRIASTENFHLKTIRWIASTEDRPQDSESHNKAECLKWIEGESNAQHSHQLVRRLSKRGPGSQWEPLIHRRKKNSTHVLQRTVERSWTLLNSLQYS